MPRLTQSFHNRLQAGETPITYIVINTDKGNRIYSEKELSGVFNQVYFIANGEARANGMITAGNGISALEKSDRLIDPGKLEKSIQPRTRDIINSLSFKQLNNIIMELNDGDDGVSSILPTEPLLTKQAVIFIGFENDSFSDHMALFNGRIRMLDVSKDKITLMVDET